MKFHKTIAFDAKSVFAILENNPFFKGTAIIAWSHIRIRMGAVVPHRPIDTAFMRTIPGVLAGIEEHWVPTADHTEVAIKTLHPSRNNGHKRTIMMVPALLTNSVTLEPLALQFVSRGYKVCLLDLRNHKVANGVCPKTYDRGWTFDDYIKFDMPAGLDFVSKTYQQKVVLVGHSMGGMVARFFTALNPELSETVIDRVVAIASPSLVRTEFNFWGSGALKFGLGFVPKTAINLGLSIT
ncbi:MAG: alpha-beta hydrolase superfamily lysophospholipase, partial [Candidatus Marinamargulisbacteria bacterium]